MTGSLHANFVSPSARAGLQSVTVQGQYMCTIHVQRGGGGGGGILHESLIVECAKM